VVLSGNAISSGGAAHVPRRGDARLLLEAAAVLLQVVDRVLLEAAATPFDRITHGRGMRRKQQTRHVDPSPCERKEVSNERPFVAGRRHGDRAADVNSPLTGGRAERTSGERDSEEAATIERSMHARTNRPVRGHWGARLFPLVEDEPSSELNKGRTL
jgi:hypothetical protein